MTLEHGIGAALILVFLADIFLTVLYARAGTGLLAPYWNRAIWAIIRTGSSIGLRAERRHTLLSLAGPIVVVSMIAFWAIGLTLGAALIIQPELGTAITPSNGQATRDFGTALFVAGNSLSIVGGSDYSPHTSATRFLFLVNSLIGASVLSLVLSYLVQVYSALRERNALALEIDLMTDETGDAAVMLARLIPNGDANDTASQLGNLARSLTAVKEAHHFYPLLFYFRFAHPRYAVSRFTFILLDLVTLIETTLDQQHYAALVRSGSVASTRRGAQMLIETLDTVFPTLAEETQDAAVQWRIRQDYLTARATLVAAGISVKPGGEASYLAKRARWEPVIARVAPILGNRMDDIDVRRAASPESSE